MSVSAETYIVISLMFAVFAAVAAVGTSVVLGAGFERLRAGFELIKNQSGFFADAIYKLDMRTNELGKETAELKAGLMNTNDRVVRVEKQAQFIGDEMNALQQRILQGSPVEAPVASPEARHFDGMDPSYVPHVEPQPSLQAQVLEISVPEAIGEESQASFDDESVEPETMPEEPVPSEGFTTLLSRYFLGEGSGSGRDIVYH